MGGDGQLRAVRFLSYRHPLLLKFAHSEVRASERQLDASSKMHIRSQVFGSSSRPWAEVHLFHLRDTRYGTYLMSARIQTIRPYLMKLLDLSHW
jgi:hypothetical protein